MRGLLLALWGLAMPAAMAAEPPAWRCSGGIPPRGEAMQATLARCERTTASGRTVSRRVLWLHGGVNGRVVDDRRVTPSSEVAGAAIARGGYDEVWLNSPGGFVHEGLAIGRALRSRRAVVRVIRHPAVSCVSACTIIAMGGHNRIIDDGAEFIVHAASSYLHALRPELRERLSCRAGMAAEACAQHLGRGLLASADEIDGDVRASLADTFGYYQQMLDGQPRANAITAVPRPPSAYAAQAPQARSLRDDALLLLTGGAVAAQEILSQLELRSARLLLDLAEAEIRRNPAPFGPGAAESIALHQTMYTCRIQDRCSLGREQLMAAGYQNFEMADE